MLANIILFHSRLTGRIAQHQSTFIATRMRWVNLTPLFPEGTFLVFTDPTTHRQHVVPIPFDGRSLFAAYGRIWPFSLLAVGLLSLFAWHQPLLGALLTGGSTLVLLAAFLIGRLSPTARAQRRAYVGLTGGVPVDPALLVHGDPELRSRIHAGLVARGGHLDTSTYRTHHDPETEWIDIALEPRMNDAAYLCAALTLVRIDQAVATATERTRLAEAHEAIWARLRPVVESGTAIDWDAWNKDRDESSPPATHAGTAEVATTGVAITYGPQPEVFASSTTAAPGRLADAGWDVSVDASAYRPLTTCASCGAPATKSLRSKKGSVSLEIPYCAPCHGHAATMATGTPLRVRQLGALVAGALVGAIGLVTALPLPVSLAAGVLLALGVGVAIERLVPPARPSAPATASVDGARVVALEGARAILFCTNRAWAAELANAQDAEPVARVRANRLAWTMAPAALFAVPVTTLLAFGFSHPEVRIDNGTGQPITIWVDGERRLTIPARKGGAVETLRIPMGSHVLGWSPDEASAPTTTTPVNVELQGRHLYNPGARDCYALEVTQYGSSALPVRPGPLPVQEFQTFKQLDDWFSSSPDKSKESGARVAIQRWELCERLEAPRCAPKAREAYWTCMEESWGDKAGMDACAKAALAQCAPK